jgi:hypothetical protein
VTSMKSYHVNKLEDNIVLLHPYAGASRFTTANRSCNKVVRLSAARSSSNSIAEVLLLPSRHASTLCVCLALIP